MIRGRRALPSFIALSLATIISQVGPLAGTLGMPPLHKSLPLRENFFRQQK